MELYTQTCRLVGKYYSASNMYHYCPQMKFAKVMFLHLCVSHSVHGGGGVCPSACWDSRPPPGSIHSPRQGRLPGKAEPPWQGRPSPPAQWMLGDTANKPVVRILLECILVRRFVRFMLWTNSTEMTTITQTYV